LVDYLLKYGAGLRGLTTTTPFATMAAPLDHGEESKRYRAKAANYREAARTVSSAQRKSVYLKVAEMYDTMAKNMEYLAEFYGRQQEEKS
jgi:hypothetical protein